MSHALRQPQQSSARSAYVPSVVRVPEQELAKAVLAQVVHDLLRGTATVQEDAQQWVRDLRGITLWADACDIDPQHFQQQALQLVREA